MKTQEELNALKEEVIVLNEKLSELSEEELEQVTGGVIPVLLGFGSPTIEPQVKYGIEQPNWDSKELPKDAGNYKIKIDINDQSQWSPSADHTSLS